MKLYNTLTKKIDELKPLNGKRVHMYSCGPTVYDHAQIGNLASFIYADTLRRCLQQAGYDVLHVMNFTDVDDKTIRRSQELYPDIEPLQALQKLTREYEERFLKDMHAIGCGTDHIKFVRATENIPAMQELVKELHKNGFAYTAEDGVYFSIEKYRQSGKKYGQLLELNTQNTSAARINNDEYDKESAHDFALWKKQKSGEPAWAFDIDGHDMTGRPGWHIECSAMSARYLGQPFDIHTGGVDLIFPHHENEIAQSTAGKETAYAQTFFHNEHLLVDGNKMSKSLHNFFTLQDIQNKGFDPLALRLLILQSHYRSQSNFTWENLESASISLRNLQRSFGWVYQSEMQENEPIPSLISYFQKFKNQLLNVLQEDLSTPKAIALLHECADGFTGFPASRLDIPAVEDFAGFVEQLLGIRLLIKHKLSKDVESLLNERQKARSQKDWSKSDQLREQLKEQGIGVSDTDHGQIWYRL